MNDFFTSKEKGELISLFKQLLKSVGNSVSNTDIRNLKKSLTITIQQGALTRNNFNLNPIICSMQTAVIVSDEIGINGPFLVGVLLKETVLKKILSLEQVKETFGHDAASIVNGLVKISELYAKNPTVESENFRNLLLSFAQDMRVILIMIADRVNIMRQIRDSKNKEDKLKVANEAAYLYAPLAHKLGLYKLKSELEDLFLKYTQHDTYYFIKDQLNQTKASRDKYIASFIEPIKKKVTESGLKFTIKGRTKTIHSIWQKMLKQKTAFENIYDLFAIRIIIDTDEDPAIEKQDCWKVFSIVTDMYTPNPNRLRDWLSIPKSNGYESLHTTVMGPQGKWVEVQIRTRRMDDIAECGLAAHWRYKGIKGENGLDEWLTSVREALENSTSDSLKVMDQFKVDLYKDEVFVFTPKGDLFKLSKGATVLDFAYNIHSKLGDTCVGAKVNGKVVQIRQQLFNGDQVEIMTSNTQTPKQDWLKIATTTRARTKIRQALKEKEARQHNIAKEALDRKFKNRKIEYDEGTLMRLIKHLGFKNITEFYQAIADNTIDINDILDKYTDQLKRDNMPHEEVAVRSAEGYNLPKPGEDEKVERDDILIIDKDMRGINFKLAKCCNPIYGDEVFGFITVSGSVTVHRTNCPNAGQLRERFGYRIIKARWAGKSEGKQYPITLRIIGNDDLGIVTNITSLISKEMGITLRSITIDSNVGLFDGTLTVMISDTRKLEALIKKIRSVKGVKQVSRN
ncbi:MAG: RelA/SpoT family protein [Bacteroidaceae bacterium]|nr:RelA/SpoT family protein [Bacteroidaceae bacterium]